MLSLVCPLYPKAILLLYPAGNLNLLLYP
jgi:hypothetical protein